MKPSPVIDSIFTGQPKTITDERGTWTSSIFRERVDGPVKARKGGLTGDRVAQPYHGGPDADICVHLMDHYRFWNDHYDFTPYPDVNAILAEVLSGAREILDKRLIGVYLYGSLAIGGFKPGRSDIDFLVVTDADLPQEKVKALQSMHRHIGAGSSIWALELEGSYIPAAALRRYDRRRRHHPHIDRGSAELTIEPHDTDWVVQRWVTRERGVHLMGPPPTALIDPISPQALRAAVRELFFFWWAPMVEEPSRLTQTGYQVYAVLTMPRILYTFVHGTVVSKPEAVAWALRVLEPRWRDLLAGALAWEEGQIFDHLEETRALIRYTGEQADPGKRPVG